MEESIARTIRGVSNWKHLRQFEENVSQRGRLTEEVKSAISARSLELGRDLVARKTGLDLATLTPAEQKIVDAASAYVAIKSAAGSNAERTFSQLRNRGLLGAAESSVCKGSPTEGFKTLADAEQSDLSYEQIVVDHPDEFSARAIWYSRRALGLPNTFPHAPTPESGDTQTRTIALISWLKDSAHSNRGFLPAFSNDDAAVAMGTPDLRKYGRPHGNIQSRVDFACFKVGLPPLGLAATQPFEDAWSRGDRVWDFPIAAMRAAARSRQWADEDFDEVLRQTERMSGQAHLLWKGALAQGQEVVRAWAFSFGDHSAPAEPLAEPTELKRNPSWVRDELILALDLYIRYRDAPLGKADAEIVALSDVLNRLGDTLGQRESPTYRNANGVYMKLMNFRRLDPQYVSDGRSGLNRGNKDEVRVWDEFANDPARLEQVAQFIRYGIEHHRLDDELSGPDEPGITEAEEGKVATRIHRYRERDRRLVEEAKSVAFRRFGRLRCCACDFDFTERYGETGAGVIDVHHTKPVHTMKPGETTKVADLALLCSNCHRIVHSKRRWLSIDQVRAVLRPIRALA